jgi:hypothetical protein
VSDAASSAIAVYGRQGWSASIDREGDAERLKEARALKRQLTAEQSRALNRIDDETDLMLKQLDDEAAKSAAPTAVAEKPGAAGRVDDPAAPKRPGKGAGKPVGAADELEGAASKIGISKERLKSEVEDLRGQTVDPDNVYQPKNTRLDAEMDAGHNFTRNKRQRTWCRHSPDDTCHLDLGDGLNKDVDDVIAKKQAKFEKLEQDRKAREAAPPRPRPKKREKTSTAETDPKRSKAKDRAKQQVARENTKKALQSQIDDAKDLELQLRVEMGDIEQRARQRLDRAERASLDAEAERSGQITNDLEAYGAAETTRRPRSRRTPRARAYRIHAAARKSSGGPGGLSTFWPAEENWPGGRWASVNRHRSRRTADECSGRLGQPACTSSRSC